MKVSYMAAFLIGLLSLESTRAAPLGPGSVKTGKVGDGSFNDISKNNQFFSKDSSSLKTSNVDDDSFDDKNDSGSLKTSNVGDDSFDDKNKKNQFWSIGSMGGSNNNNAFGNVNNGHMGIHFNGILGRDTLMKPDLLNRLRCHYASRAAASHLS